MDDERLHLAVWDRLTSAERGAVAREVAGRLPAPFRLLGLEWHALGDQRHEVAFFDWQGARFALIPGGTVTLGYDRAQHVDPHRFMNEQDAKEYARFHDLAELVLDMTTYDIYMSRSLTPFRVVTLAPFLLEVHSRIIRSLPYLPAGYLIPEWYNGHSHLPYLLYRDIKLLVERDGFRLPTDDEWEHANSAGSRTLWRWGDWCPSTYNPGETDEEVAHDTWDLYRRPNAFGLQMPDRIDHLEVCAEGGLLRGGDAAMNPGTYGVFLSWITLASAYSYSEYDGVSYEPYLRRAYTIP